MAASPARADSPRAPLLARLRAGDQRPLDELYRDYRVEFEEWLQRKYPDLRGDEAADFFQRAVIIFYEQIRRRKIRYLTSSPRTYVFLIGERICYREKIILKPPIKVYPISVIKEKEGEQFLDELMMDDQTFLTADELSEYEEEVRARVARGLLQLSVDCRHLLTDFYYNGLSLAELSIDFGHRDIEVTTVRKSQCLARLRELCGVKRR